MNTEKTREETLQEIGKNALASIRDMVAALECDYDRLEELREDRDGFAMDEDENDIQAWTAEHPQEAEELAELEAAASATGNECTCREDAEQQISEDPLSIEFRSGWVTDKSDMVAEEAMILLTTGGPAVRIMVELDDGEPLRAYLQVQDWGTPWTEYYESGIGELLMTYVRCFCFD